MKRIGEKFLSVIMLLLAAMALAPAAQAITAEEMDHARAVAAKLYLRWANNGSDYLDPLDPKSLAELEGKLKEKEKENIKAFKSVSTPSDYAKWDKAKAVEYWSVTFFKSSALSEDGRRARGQVKKKLEAMTFSAPSAEAPKAAETAAEPAPELPSAAPAPEGQAAAPAAPAEAEATAELPSAEEIMAQTEATDSLAGVIADTATEQQKKQSGSNSWMYIVALVVLVGIVVWLVIFASRTMQQSAKAARDLDDDDEAAPASRALPAAKAAVRAPEVVVEETAIVREQVPVRGTKIRTAPVVAEDDAEESESILRDRYARRIAAKDTEIHELQRQVRDLRDENLRLADENSRLSQDLSMARREMEALKARAASAASPSAAPEVAPRPVQEQAPVREPRPAAAPAAMPQSHAPATRDIYLGRVNAKGIFVRADRRPIEGKSVYVLSTSDSYTGTFRVLQAASTIDMALDNPDYYLSGGCVATDLFDTQEADGIRTVSSGTAIFEDGCWRVLRKAKIAYE